MSITPEQSAWFATTFGQLVANIEKAVVGKTRVVQLAVTCMLAEGHLLLEDFPGTGKTSLARASLPRKTPEFLAKTGHPLVELRLIQTGDLHQLAGAVVPLDQADLVRLDPRRPRQKLDDRLVRAPVLRRVNNRDGGAVPVETDDRVAFAEWDDFDV